MGAGGRHLERGGRLTAFGTGRAVISKKGSAARVGHLVLEESAESLGPVPEAAAAVTGQNNARQPGW